MGMQLHLRHRMPFYLALDQGRTVRPLQTSEGVPESVRWYSNGSRLRVELCDRGAATFSFWDLTFGGPIAFKIDSLVPLKTELTEFFNGSMGNDQSGRSFLVGGEPGNTGILVLAKNHGILHNSYALQDVNIPMVGASNVALDQRGKRFFAIGFAAVQQSTRKEHADILWFDQSAREFRPFPAGSGGEYVAFSRDGRWIRYFSSLGRVYMSAELTVRKHGDSFFPMEQFSCLDGARNRIAFMEQVPRRPLRIYLISVSGSPPERQAGGRFTGCTNVVSGRESFGLWRS